jgi:DNA-directed RNA polymerase subunit RPC12/RpoP
LPTYFAAANAGNQEGTNMIATTLIWPCEHCNKDFRLISEDSQSVPCNYCPNCGKRNEIKFRVDRTQNSIIPLGLTAQEAEALVAAQMIAVEETSDRVGSFLDRMQPTKKLKLPVISEIMKHRTLYIQKYSWAKVDSGLIEYIELSEDYVDAFADKLRAMSGQKIPNPSAVEFLGMKVRARSDLPSGTVQIVAINNKTKAVVRGPI